VGSRATMKTEREIGSLAQPLLPFLSLQAVDLLVTCKIYYFSFSFLPVSSFFLPVRFPLLVADPAVGSLSRSATWA